MHDWYSSFIGLLGTQQAFWMIGIYWCRYECS